MRKILLILFTIVFIFGFCLSKMENILEDRIIYTENNIIYSSSIKTSLLTTYISNFDILSYIPLTADLINIKVEYLIPNIKYIIGLCKDKTTGKVYCIARDCSEKVVLYELYNEINKKIYLNDIIYKGSMFFFDGYIYYTCKNENGNILKTISVDDFSENVVCQYPFKNIILFKDVNGYVTASRNYRYNDKGDDIETVIDKINYIIHKTVKKVSLINKSQIVCLSDDYNKILVLKNGHSEEIGYNNGIKWGSIPMFSKDLKRYIVKKRISAKYLFNYYTLNTIYGGCLFLPIEEAGLVIIE